MNVITSCGNVEIEKDVEKYCMFVAVKPKVPFPKVNKLESVFCNDNMQVQYCRTQSTAENTKDPTTQFLIKCKLFPEIVKVLFDLNDNALGNTSTTLGVSSTMINAEKTWMFVRNRSKYTEPTSSKGDVQ